MRHAKANDEVPKHRPTRPAVRIVAGVMCVMIFLGGPFVAFIGYQNHRWIDVLLGVEMCYIGIHYLGVVIRDD